MLTAVSVGLCGVVLFLLARYWARLPDALGRKPFPAISVVVLSSMSIVAGAPAALTRDHEGRLTRVASALAGRPVRVHCQTVGESLGDTGSELGYVLFRPDGTPQPRAVIKRPQCRDLTAYLRSGAHGDPDKAQTVAVHVLSHEAMHLAGIRDEAEAECAAMQRDARTAVLLGASPAEGVVLARLYWERVYPNMPPEYRSRACEPGGELDERLPGAPWS